MARERDLLREKVERISTALKCARETAAKIAREREAKMAAFPKIPKRTTE